MANTTLGNLKIAALKRVHHYNSADSTLLSLAGGLINDALSIMYPYLKKTPYVFDLKNSVSTVASTAYVDLTDTDIVDILNVYQGESDTKLKRLSWEEYVALVPDTSEVTGIPEIAYCPTQNINVSGQNIFRLYLIPTPGSAITLYYDYIKNIRFSTDDADSEFCILPSIYDPWIYAEFKPLFYRIVAPKDTGVVRSAEVERDRMRIEMGGILKENASGTPQLGMFGGDRRRQWTTASTPIPT